MLPSVLGRIPDLFCGLLAYRLRSACLGIAALRTSIRTKITVMNA